MIMVFKLTMAGRLYTKDDAEKYKELGFEFEEYQVDRFMHTYRNQRLLSKKDVKIEINSIEELIDFMNKWGELVLNQNEIEIYNDYRE
jgi:biotin-(acetyl-CoA carboxylase) ligase